MEDINLKKKVSTSKLLDRIDYQLIETDNFEFFLLYTLPLIERLIIEVLKFESYADIEVFDQGIYRTLNSILDNNKIEFLENDEILLLKELFKENGIRNTLYHPNEIKTVNIYKSFIKSIRNLTYKLIENLKLIDKDYDSWQWKQIETINVEN